MRPSVMTRRVRLGGLLLVALGLLAALRREWRRRRGPDRLTDPDAHGHRAAQPHAHTHGDVAHPDPHAVGHGDPHPDAHPDAHRDAHPDAHRDAYWTVTETPTETPTETVTETPTQTPTQTPTEAPEDQAAEGQSGEDDGVPSWVWWVAAAVVLGCLVAVPLVVRGRRRASWQRELERQEAEVEWFARDLLRELRLAGSHEEMAGGWAVSQKRVAAAEDELTVLESTAPDEAGGPAHDRCETPCATRAPACNGSSPRARTTRGHSTWTPS